MPPVPARRDRGALEDVGAVLLGQQLARGVDRRPGDVGVDVHPARHDDHPARVDACGRAWARRRRSCRPARRRRAPRRRCRWRGRRRCRRRCRSITAAPRSRPARPRPPAGRRRAARAAGPARRPCGATVPATSMPSAAVAKATRAAFAVSVSRASTTTVGSSRRRRQPASSASQADHERGVDLAALEQRGGAELAGVGARVAAREAHRRGEAGLPGEDVLGAARVAVAAQRQRDGVAIAAEVAHEREQRERAELVERAMQEGDVVGAEQALGELAERVERQVARAVAIERRARDERAQRPQRLEVLRRVELDEGVGLLGGGRALRVDDDERPRPAGGAIQAQPAQQARVGDGRVRPPRDDELGAVADLAEGGRARADRLVGEARARCRRPDRRSRRPPRRAPPPGAAPRCSSGPRP